MQTSPEALILIVDDQADNLDTIMGYLKEAVPSYKYSQALNGELACKIAQKRLPDLIIMDWEMPVMNGLDALICIKKNPLTTDIPVIMATGRSSGHDLDIALNNGASDYIRKPIEKQELLARVRTCLSISKLIKEIKGKNDKLKDLNREKDGMVDVVAHDLKSPLNNIKGYMELIRLEGELNINQQEHAKSITDLINEGCSLIGDILDIHSYEHTNSTLDISTFKLDDFIALWRSNYEQELSRKKQILEISDVAKEISIKTDKSILTRIFDNLLTNAIKFSDTDKSIYLNTNIKDDILNISLRDEGPGISEEDQKIMFQMFQKLSAKPTGDETSNGLGLSIIKMLVEKLNGSIEVTSELGEGTTFIIKLPLSDSN